MSNSIFNPKKTYFDLMALLSYINSPDLFNHKFLKECIGNFSQTTDNVGCHLTYQTGHLNNKKLKMDFLRIFNSIVDSLRGSPKTIEEIKDKFIVMLDNATKNLSVVFEFNSLTTTITIVSVPLEPEKQPSIHTRKKLYETFYFASKLKIFIDNDNDLYTLSGRNKLYEVIDIFKLKTLTEPETLISFSVLEEDVEEDDSDNLNLLKSELLNTLCSFTGFNIRDTDIQNFKDKNVSLLKDDKGFYLKIGNV